jgi:hypothetical protein
MADRKKVRCVVELAVPSYYPERDFAWLIRTALNEAELHRRMTLHWPGISTSRLHVKMLSKVLPFLHG